jgi:hypothetical protein
MLACPPKSGAQHFAGFILYLHYIAFGRLAFGSFDGSRKYPRVKSPYGFCFVAVQRNRNCVLHDANKRMGNQ